MKEQERKDKERRGEVRETIKEVKGGSKEGRNSEDLGRRRMSVWSACGREKRDAVN